MTIPNTATYVARERERFVTLCPKCNRRCAGEKGYAMHWSLTHHGMVRDRPAPVVTDEPCGRFEHLYVVPPERPIYPANTCVIDKLTSNANLADFTYALEVATEHVDYHLNRAERPRDIALMLFGDKPFFPSIPSRGQLVRAYAHAWLEVTSYIRMRRAA